MPRGARKWTESTVARLQKEGRGQGRGADYKPWIQVGEFSSLGNSRRIFSNKTGRDHHLFSDIEYALFLLLEWSLDVTDIWEQHPLDRSLTQEIAAALGIRHPFYPGTQVPAVMTVDFLVTRTRHGTQTQEAFNAKPASAAEDPREIEKLEIQRSYFDDSGIAHHLVFDALLPQQKVRNIEWIRDGAMRTGESQRYEGFYNDLMVRMADQLAAGVAAQPLNQYCACFDVQLGLEPGMGLRIARMLMHKRILIADLASPDLPAASTSAFAVGGRQGVLRAVGGA